MRKYDDPRLMERQACRAGPRRAAREPDLYDSWSTPPRARTSRSSAPRRAPPRIRNCDARRRPRAAALRDLSRLRSEGPDDEYVSVLPLPWIMEQVYVLGKGLLCRMKINFVEEPETMMNDLREIAPTFRAVCTTRLGIRSRRRPRQGDGCDARSSSACSMWE
jgi:long-chain acyl-CoA synthetase